MSKTITMGQIQDGGKPLTLNVDSLVESKLLVQANSGGGKSNTIRLLSEKLAPIMPFVIIDPEGEFATLREKVDLVLVGEGGELATTPQNAGQIALKLLDLGVSAVIDLFHLVPAQRREWVRRYCENIVAAPKKMWRPFALLRDEPIYQEGRESRKTGGKAEDCPYPAEIAAGRLWLQGWHDERAEKLGKRA